MRRLMNWCDRVVLAFIDACLRVLSNAFFLKRLRQMRAVPMNVRARHEAQAQVANANVAAAVSNAGSRDAHALLSSLGDGQVRRGPSRPVLRIRQSSPSSTGAQAPGVLVSGASGSESDTNVTK